MYLETVNAFAATAEKKAALLRGFPLSFLVGAMMAGAYVGLGIILIFSVGATVDPAWQRLVMGASFGIALTLVVFAGSELFTGLTMVMPLGFLQGRIGARAVLHAWALSWSGNLLGALLLAGVFYLGGGGALLKEGAPLLFKVVSAKMNAPAIELFARAVLCNWLVCLALWMAARTQSDAAKLGAIFWCLFAFIASGYEHSVANMSLFAIALCGAHPESVSIAGMGHNLLWVSLGNVLAGAGLMAGAYWFASRPRSAGQSAPVTTGMGGAGPAGEELR